MVSVRRVIRRYYLYHATLSSGFYLPVYVVYLQHRGFGLPVIGLTAGAFSIAMVASEIPTGYIGDRIGRRASLAAGNALSALALGAFVLADTPLEYVGLYAVWAVGWTFRSGTSDAWLYDHLDHYGCADEYTRVQSRASTVTLVVSAGSAIAAGLLVTVSWNLPFVVNAIQSALGVPIALALPSEVRSDDAAHTFTVRDAVEMLRLQIGRPAVRWFVVYAALFSAIFNLARIFEQPALRAVGVPIPALGFLYAGFKLLSAGAVSTSGWVEERFGTRGTFALLAPVYGVAALSIVFVPTLVVPFVFLNRGLRVLVAPIQNQYLNDQFSGVGRATVLSGASMVLSLASASAKLAGGEVAETTGPVRFIALSGVVLTVAAGVVWVTTNPVRPVAESESAATSDGASATSVD